MWAAAAARPVGLQGKKHLSEALTRCDTSRAAGVRSRTASPLQAPRGINVTALHFHLSPEWPRRSAKESPGGRSQAEGGWSQAERSRADCRQDGKMFSDTDGWAELVRMVFN